MQPISVHHVSVNVSNPAESIEFYTGVLGGTVRADRPDFGIGGAWIDLGGTQVHLIESAVPPNMGQHFAILLDDIDAAVEELRAKGIEVEDARIVGPDRQTFINDPDGNRSNSISSATLHPEGRSRPHAAPSAGRRHTLRPTRCRTCPTIRPLSQTGGSS